MYVIGGIAVLPRIDPHTLFLFRREGRSLPLLYAPDCPPLFGVGGGRGHTKCLPRCRLFQLLV